MTPQYEYATKIMDKLQAAGIDATLDGDADSRLLAIRSGNKRVALGYAAAMNGEDPNAAADRIIAMIGPSH